MKRAEFIAQARSWLGTPFRHQGRIKGVGVDCAGLVLSVLGEMGHTEWFERFRVYPQMPVGRQVHEICQEILIEKTVDQMKPGDILTLRVPTAPVHVAIVTDQGILHAYSGGPGRVVETNLGKWGRRIEGVFTIPGMED